MADIGLAEFCREQNYTAKLGLVLKFSAEMQLQMALCT